MEDKVSIIVPIYKSEAYIYKLVDSILNQTYKNIETILVDDESPDNCPQICDEYKRRDERVIVIHQKNKGTCEARNTGLKIASGKYLTFADGDDWMEPECIEYLIKILKETKSQMATTDAIFTSRDRNQNYSDVVRKLSTEDAICELIYDKIPVGPWNKLYTTKIIKENNISFSVPWFGEGLYFSVMAAQYSKNVVVGHRKVYNYRLNNPNSGTVIMKVENGINSLNNINYIRKKLTVKSEKIDYALNWHIWENIYNLMMFIIANGSDDSYLDYYEKCKNYIRKNFKNVIKKSEISKKEKIKILLESLFPKLIINISLKKTIKKFKQDIAK